MSLLRVLEKAESDCELELALCNAMCEVIDSPHSLAIHLLLEAGMYEELKDFEPDPANYLDDKLESISPCLHRALPTVTNFRYDRQVSRMLIKSSNLPLKNDPDSVAIETFRDIEALNETNYKKPPLRAPWLLELGYEINRLLGGDESGFLTSRSLTRVIENGALGPGSSSGMNCPVITDKLRRSSSIGPRLVPFASAIKGEAWVKHSQDSKRSKLKVIPAVAVVTVPKNAFTSRTISPMPLLNMYVQLGLGEILRERLRLFGCDTSDQTINQRLSQEANVKKLATIDLKSASSWFTERNMEGILPNDLMHFLRLVRPEYYKLEGDTPHYMYNFAPMGAGYTFNLMSLYFLALARITVPRELHDLVSIYGDDIIIPQEYAAEFVSRLEFLEFQVNHRKTFMSGNFFESCGTEWFHGHDVLPFYCRRGAVGTGGEPMVPIVYRVQLANKLRRWAWQPSGYCEKRWRPIWDRLIKPVARRDRPCVPFHLGDVGLTTSLNESKLQPDTECHARGWEQTYKVYYRKIVRQTVNKQDVFSVLFYLLNRRKTEDVPGEELDAPTRKPLSRKELYYPVKGSSTELKPFLGGTEPLITGKYSIRTRCTLVHWETGFDWA